MPNNARPTNGNDEPMIKYDCKLIIMPLLGILVIAVGVYIESLKITQSFKLHLYATNGAQDQSLLP